MRYTATVKKGESPLDAIAKLKELGVRREQIVVNAPFGLAPRIGLWRGVELQWANVLMPSGMTLDGPALQYAEIVVDLVPLHVAADEKDGPIHRPAA